jgi:hypothetical protein
MTGPVADGEQARQLDEARAQVRLLTEQLAIAERVHQKLRGRIAALERALEVRGTPLPPTEPADDGQPAPPVEEYGFGEHDDDLLPAPDPQARHGRWRHR